MTTTDIAPSAVREDEAGASRVLQIALAVIGFRIAIFLMPAFNDFPIGRGHFMRSPSYYGVVMFIPLALACLWQPLPRARMPVSLLMMFAFLASVYLSAFVNFLRYATDQAGMMYLMVMVQTCIIFTMQICMALATRALLLSGLVDFDMITRIVRVSIGLIVLYCCYEILAYFSGIGFFHDTLKAVEPFLHGLTTLNPMSGDVIEVHTPRVRGLTMEPSYFSAVFAFAFPILIYNCIKTRAKLDMLIAALFLVMIVISGARTAIAAILAGAALTAILLALGYGRIKLVVAGVILGTGLLAAAAVLLPVQQIIIGSIDLSPTKFSNIMRLGGLIGTFRLAMDHILFGVGPGLSPYFVGAYYPDFVFNSPVADKWFTGWKATHESFSGVARILSDMGSISFVLYLAMWFVPVFYCSRSFVRRLRRDRVIDYQALFLAIIIMSQFQASLTIEPTTFVGYWIALGMALAYLSQQEDGATYVPENSAPIHSATGTSI